VITTLNLVLQQYFVVFITGLKVPRWKESHTNRCLSILLMYVN